MDRFILLKITAQNYIHPQKALIKKISAFLVGFFEEGFLKMNKLTEILQDDKNELLNRIDNCREMTNVQGRNGNWNFDPYMQGMFNGMEFLLAILENREPVFKPRPEKWLRDIRINCIPTTEEAQSE